MNAKELKQLKEEGTIYKIGSLRNCKNIATYELGTGWGWSATELYLFEKTVTFFEKVTVAGGKKKYKYISQIKKFFINEEGGCDNDEVEDHVADLVSVNIEYLKYFLDGTDLLSRIEAQLTD